MSTPARRRLMRDFKKLQEDPPAGVSGAPTEDNILVWHAIIFGPQDTPFEDGTFKLVLEFTEDYPNKPPSVKFVSKMFHPNVYADGSICLDILQNRWSPTYDVAAILTSIQSLLDEPNPNSPANSLAAQLYQENRREYEKRVQQIVEQSWLSFSENDGPEEKKSLSSAANNDAAAAAAADIDAASTAAATGSAAAPAVAVVSNNGSGSNNNNNNNNATSSTTTTTTGQRSAAEEENDDEEEENSSTSQQQQLHNQQRAGGSGGGGGGTAQTTSSPSGLGSSSR